MSSVVELDVSGVTDGFKVSKTLLQKVQNSHLASMFSGQQNLTQVNGKIFLDRNPKVFGLVLDFLRNDQEEIKIDDPVLRNLFLNELKFWGLGKKSEEEGSN